MSYLHGFHLEGEKILRVRSRSFFNQSNLVVARLYGAGGSWVGGEDGAVLRSRLRA